MSIEHGGNPESQQNKDFLTKVLGSVVDISKGVFNAILEAFGGSKKN